MKNYNILKLSVSLIVLCFTVVSAKSQTNNSSYFLEGMTYRHELNPAFASERSYLNMPLFVLGDLNIGVQGNVGVNDFLYKYNQNGYSLTTFMSPTVDAKEFLGRLSSHNNINLNISMPVVSFGFHAWGGFNSFEIGVKSRSSVSLPYSLFDFMKTGMSDAAHTEYNVKDLRMRSNNYVELALGHSRRFLDNKLSVGAKLKFLVGGANAEVKFDDMKITMSEDRWNIKASGEMNGSMKGLYFTYDSDGSVDGVEVDSPGIGGYGMGVDLGASYDLSDFVKGLKVSAAILDLGFIKWEKGIRGTLKDEYTFNGFELPVVVDPEDGDPGDIDSQIDKIGDDLEDFIQIKEDPNPRPRTTMLGATLNIGAEYALPVYKRLRFGLLSSTYIEGPFTNSEARISANIAPVKWFEASVNYAIGTFGSSLGWVLNFHPKGFNFFIGTSHMFTNITPQGVPVGNANMNINIGFNITWGAKKI